MSTGTTVKKGGNKNNKKGGNKKGGNKKAGNKNKNNHEVKLEDKVEDGELVITLNSGRKIPGFPTTSPWLQYYPLGTFNISQGERAYAPRLFARDVTYFAELDLALRNGRIHNRLNFRPKKEGYLLNVSGTHGMNGLNGGNGQDGTRAIDGPRFGARGRNAQNGFRGQDGVPGGHGTNGQDLKLTLLTKDDGKTIEITGTEHCASVELEPDAYISILSMGGTGGIGGDGGNGGKGGDGGNGHDGKPGKRGHNSHYRRGGDGHAGGNGGDGGNGGKGGRGGNGANGGNGGNGGEVILTTFDSRVFMAVHVNAHEGLSGSFGLRGLGGLGGAGGRGGKGGPGGEGGKGGTFIETTQGKDGQTIQTTKNYPKGNKGDAGKKGKDGQAGVAGGIGKRGKCGLNGLPGKVLFRVVDSSGRITAEGPTVYDPAIIYLTMTDGMKDNIFEPGEELHISGVEIHNFGSIPLPKGTQLSFPTTETIENVTPPFSLPEIQAFKTSTISHVFKVKIPDVPSPTEPGPYSAKAVFRPELTLLNRQFEQCTYSIEVDVKYPLKLVNIKGSKQMGRGDSGTFRVGVRNLSTRTYGDVNDKDTEVSVRFYFTEFLQAVGGETVPDSKETFFEVKLDKIPSGETAVVEARAVLSHEAPLFHRIPWRAELFLRKKKIEIRKSVSRVAPIYNASNPPSDVLLITGPSITRDEYLAWMKILDGLALKADLWDIEHEHGVSINSKTKRPHTAWKGRYGGKIIIFPMGNPLDAALLEGEDVLAHFTAVEKADQLIGEDKSGSRKSLLINADPALLAKMGASSGALPTAGGTGHTFERFHFTKPTWCNHCGNFIWGLGKQGYRCETCKFAAHDKCYKLITVRCGEKVPVPEGGKKPASDGSLLKHTTNKKALKEQQRKSEATAFDSSMIILGADPIALRERVLKASPVLTFKKDEFAASHVVTTPNQNYAVRKARVIRRRLEKGDPNHYFQQGELKVKLKKHSGNRWHYGKLTIHRCPINSASRLMIRPAVANGERLVTEQFNPLNQADNKYPITSYFTQVFVALLQGLPLSQRLALLSTNSSKSLAQEQGWKFSYHGGSATLSELIKLTLYQDLKTDIDTQNKLMFNHAALAEALHKSEFQTPEIKKLVWYCENRIKSSCFSVNLFGSKHSMSKKVNKEFSTIHKLIGTMDPDTKRHCDADLKVDRTRHLHFNIWAALGSTIFPLRRQRKKYERARRAGLTGIKKK